MVDFFSSQDFPLSHLHQMKTMYLSIGTQILTETGPGQIFLYIVEIKTFITQR